MLLLSAAQKRSSGEHAQGRIDAGIPADKYTDDIRARVVPVVNMGHRRRRTRAAREGAEAENLPLFLS